MVADVRSKTRTLVDPYSLMGKLVKKDRRKNARVYTVVNVAGMYVQLGPTENCEYGAKRVISPHRWYDYEHLIKVAG